MKMNMDYAEVEKDDEKKLDDHEIDCAMDTLLKAETIKADAKMMAAIKPKIEEKKSALNKITSLDQLKKVAKDKISKQAEEDEKA